jgi:Na+/pantothenate symporter
MDVLAAAMDAALASVVETDSTLVDDVFNQVSSIDESQVEQKVKQKQMPKIIDSIVAIVNLKLCLLV